MPVYLIPVSLSENTRALSIESIEIARNIDEFIVENEKSARHFLKSIHTNVPQSELIFHLLNEHSSPEEISLLLEVIKQQKDIGIMSEAGCPGIADPGAAVVKMAHENNIIVRPLAGPSSILLALMGSGMNGQSFTFHGYLPKESADRKRKLLQIEKESIAKNQAQVFIETPYRNIQLVNDILSTCSPGTRLCIAAMLTSKDEFIKTNTVEKWKNNIPGINKVPAVFIIGR
jgi:16S rRNA (cytidine1402-2'-O)-methyltransferase